MRKVFCLILLLISIIVFIWCQYIGLTLNFKDLPKRIATSPIEGSWRVEKYVSTYGTTIDDKKANGLVGKVAYFSGDTVDFNGSTSKDPKYKVKSVDAKRYFWDVIKISAKTLGIQNDDVQIITISLDDIFYDEYIKLDNVTLIKNYEGGLLYFHKVKDSSTNISHNGDKDNNTKVLISKAEKEIRSKSGLLLGLRYENPSVGVGQSKYLYKTLFISSVNDKIPPIAVTKDLLLPRQNGFWKVGVSEEIENGTARDVLWSYPINLVKSSKINKTINTNSNSNQMKYTKTEDHMVIKFLGSDYVSIDTMSSVNSNVSKRDYSGNQLKILPMDNLLGDSIKLTSIFGGGVQNSILPGSLLNSPESIQNESRKKVDTNWGVIRRSGRWILRGRMETKVNSESSFIDFDISYATPKSLTTYDDLFPSFNVIKMRVPSAVDAYSSPNRDFVVVLTTTKLMVFTITRDKLDENPLTLKFNAEETPVMSHWATGNYVDSWRKEVK